MKTLVLLLSLSMAGCAIPSVGTRCDAGVAYCSSKTAALSCQGGTLINYACTGPQGCSLGAARAVLCDQSVGAVAGTPCFPEYDGKGFCSSDSKSTLQCIHGSWVGVACTGATACYRDPGGYVCR